MKKNKPININDIPNEVLFVWAASAAGNPIGWETYNNAVEKYPEYFPEEVEYRKKWAKVPEEIKNKYLDFSMRLNLTKEEEDERELLFGKCPHPDILGCGIIERVAKYGDRWKDFDENDEWLSKWYKHRHKKEVDLYNELFNPYGLSKDYDK